jgi:hypothetical protein
VQRGNSETAIKETTQCVIENGFMNALAQAVAVAGPVATGNREAIAPTQSSLDDIAREVDEEDTIASRTKRDHRSKKLMKFMAKTVVAQNAHLAKLTILKVPWTRALVLSSRNKKDNAWCMKGGDVERLTTYDSKVDDGLMEYDTLFHQVFDRMSYEGLGLDGFDANEALGAIKLSKVLSNDCVHRIMGLASPGKQLKRHDVRALLSYLLYFGIGGSARGAAVQKLRWHLDGRSSNSRADPALNFKVDQDVSPCVATIFEIGEIHKPV